MGGCNQSIRELDLDGGGRISELVSLVDLPPTLLDAAGLPIPDEMSGHSILPLLAGQTGGWPQEVLVQISETQVGRAIRTHRWKYAVSAPGLDGKRDASAAHYIEEFLYDLHGDPYELTNLVGLESHREVAARMGERLLRRIVEMGEAEAAIELAPTRFAIGQRDLLPGEEQP